MATVGQLLEKRFLLASGSCYNQLQKTDRCPTFVEVG
jgi:hypothetical protein